MIITMKGGYFNMSLFWVFGLKGRTSENCRSLKDLGKLYARSEATLIMPVVKLLPPFAMEEMKLWSHLSGKRFLRCLSWDGCWLLLLLLLCAHVNHLVSVCLSFCVSLSPLCLIIQGGSISAVRSLPFSPSLPPLQNFWNIRAEENSGGAMMRRA